MHNRTSFFYYYYFDTVTGHGWDGIWHLRMYCTRKNTRLNPFLHFAIIRFFIPSCMKNIWINSVIHWPCRHIEFETKSLLTGIQPLNVLWSGRCGPVCDALGFGFRSPLSPLLCFMVGEACLLINAYLPWMPDYTPFILGPCLSIWTFLILSLCIPYLWCF